MLRHETVADQKACLNTAVFGDAQYDFLLRVRDYLNLDDSIFLFA
jgi:hypothetical protein